MVKAQSKKKTSSQRVARLEAEPKKAVNSNKKATSKKAKPSYPAPKKTPVARGRGKSKRAAVAVDDVDEGGAVAGAEAGAVAAAPASAPAPTSRKSKKRRAVSSAAPVNTADKYFDGGVNESAAPTVALLNTFESNVLVARLLLHEITGFDFLGCAQVQEDARSHEDEVRNSAIEKLAEFAGTMGPDLAQREELRSLFYERGGDHHTLLQSCGVCGPIGPICTRDESSTFTERLRMFLFVNSLPRSGSTVCLRLTLLTLIEDLNAVMSAVEKYEVRWDARDATR